MKLVESVRLRFEPCGWRFFISLPVSFLLLSLFFVYDRSYLDSAILMLDHQFTPLFSDYDTINSSVAPPPSPPPASPPASCNIFDGKWVYDESYPLYNSCHLAEKDFRCHDNGRPDRSYQKWRWQPHDCEMPKFDASDMLARLQGMRVVIVGDSMGRTQWESLNCLLLQAVPKKSSVKMVMGPITKQKPYIGTRFEDHNVSLDYYRSPFIVQSGGDIPKRSPERVRTTVKLKKMDEGLGRKMIDADVLLINSGHWWTKEKTYHSGCYFQVDEKLMKGMSVMDAYERAMSTVTSWVNDHVDFNRTEVFFRSYEPPHWELPMATQLYSEEYSPGDYPRARILKNAVGQMKTPATVLNITYLSAYRPDGHVFNWTGHKIVDCAHWCLPGVPDTWNELLYASLLLRGRGVWAAKP